MLFRSMATQYIMFLEETEKNKRGKRGGLSFEGRKSGSSSDTMLNKAIEKYIKQYDEEYYYIIKGISYYSYDDLKPTFIGWAEEEKKYYFNWICHEENEEEYFKYYF